MGCLEGWIDRSIDGVGIDSSVSLAHQSSSRAEFPDFFLITGLSPTGCYNSQNWAPLGFKVKYYGDSFSCFHFPVQAAQCGDQFFSPLCACSLCPFLTQTVPQVH